ncbi:replication endonuclease [Pseudoalteromonas luteoviolacea]|uniref:Replication initiation protein n=1 Tax=Pseudoalteromonas luteoviolacea NCIMB 1942 TaxID=1365253 RepID=A0A167AZ60_9GAMM|nr:replication endonuclease [Pseudoalteromonas luteoviolacea]KZN45971.1 replication initiation protein [Pseudoalteromonas luteoviolacea NCIMB 1942]
MNSRSIPLAYEPTKSGSLRPICITAEAPFCWGKFGFDELAEYVKEQLRKIPTTRLRRIAARQYVKRFQSKSAKRPMRSANIYIRELVERVGQVIERAPLNIGELNNSKKRKSKAGDLAQICERMAIVDLPCDIEEMTEGQAIEILYNTYDEMAEFVRGQGVSPHAWTVYEALLSGKCKNREKGYLKLERAILRMSCPKWWLRKLNRLRDMTLEHLNITMGMVKKKVSPYASKDAIAEFRGDRRKQREWLSSMVVESEDGDQIDLMKVYKGSIANPELRRIELMVRLRGCEVWANEQGLKAMFYTITAPSKYHAVSDKYDNSSPRETQEYLVNQWAKVRATLAKFEIKLFGIRVAEPHHDATPHWHLLLFMRPNEERYITSVIRHFAMQVDGDESGAEENRFDVEPIDPNKGSAVGYIAKYISKNINASHIEGEIDYETDLPFNREIIKTQAEQDADKKEAEKATARGEQVKEKPRTDENWMAVNVGAWANRWRIRQFQFIGGAPVGVWRELRRIDDEQAKKLDAQTNDIRSAADNSRFADFIERMGGAFAKRCERPFQLLKGKTSKNDYGESNVRTSGIFAAFSDIDYVTRTIQWRLTKRPKARGSESPWSTGNNCNPEPNDWQVRHGDKLNPINLIPPEIRSSVRLGATYIETDEFNKTVTEYRVSCGQLMQESVFYD